MSADVVIIGAGVSGLAAAITARDSGASVISVDENFDIGGRGMLSGGRVHLGGGHALQQKAGIKDTADQIFKDWIRHDAAVARYSDRDLVRVFADENLPTFNFLVENGVEFIEKPIGPEAASTVPRTFVTVEWQNQDEIYAPGGDRNGSGLVRRLEQSARKKGVQILLRHEMKSIVREHANSGRVLGIAVAHPGGTLNIEAQKGVIIATGGHTGNVNFRRTFDPRLTEEYQQACLPYVFQGAKGELAAMEIGASLWATANQTSEFGAAITKTRHIGCRWGYSSLVFQPESKLFPLAKATGLTVSDWQNMIFVEPERPAVLERGRRLVSLLRGRHGAIDGRQHQAQRRRPDLGDLRRRRGGAARNGTRSPRMSIRTATSPAPIRSPSWRPRSRIRIRSSRCRAPSCRRPSTATIRSSRRAPTPISRSRPRCTRSRSRRSTPPGRRRSCTTRSPACARTPTAR